MYRSISYLEFRLMQCRCCVCVCVLFCFSFLAEKLSKYTFSERKHVIFTSIFLFGSKKLITKNFLLYIQNLFHLHYRDNLTINIFCCLLGIIAGAIGGSVLLCVLSVIIFCLLVKR